MVLPAQYLRSHAEKQVHVERVHFVGINRTKTDALILESKSLFLQKTFRDLVVAAYDAKQHMEKVGLFRDVDVVIGTNANSSYEVQFLAREPGPKALVNANVSNLGEAGIGIDTTWGTVFGRGEQLSAEATLGHKHTNMLHFGFTKPLLNIRDASVGMHVFRSFIEQPWTGIGQTENGLSAVWRWEMRENLFQELKWLGSWRQVHCMTRKAPLDVRIHSGHSLKSSIVHGFKYTTLDSGILPTRGVWASLSHEVAGLGGDTHFIRHEAEFRTSVQLPLQLILSLGASAQYLIPSGGRRVNVLDRVFLGGPTNLRGFTQNGAGPCSNGSFIGGVASFCGVAHLFRPLFPRNLLYAHAFAAVGNVFPARMGAQFSDVVSQMASTPRSSVGFGLAVKLGEMARIELNYCWPFTNHPLDSIRPGFQFGIGISFL